MFTEPNEHISEMYRVDQGARFAARGKRDGSANYLVYVVDAAHNYWIHRIIQRYGYPTKELVGDESLHRFCILILHQNRDLLLQEECLAKCDFRADDKALLSDKVCMKRGQKQLYGTQFYRGEDGVLRHWPIEDEAGLDVRRASVGLDSFAEQFRRVEGIERELYGETAKIEGSPVKEGKDNEFFS